MLSKKIVFHKFKQNEWLCSKEELIRSLEEWNVSHVGPSYGYDKMLEQYFELQNWTRNDVDHFLSVHFHMARGKVMHHHFRAVVTLLGSMKGGGSL